jgi:hypothetical protein
MRNRRQGGVGEEQGENRGREDVRHEHGERGANDPMYGHRGNYERTLQQEDRYFQGGEGRFQERGYGERDFGNERGQQQGGQRDFGGQRDYGRPDFGGPRDYSPRDYGQRDFGGQRDYGRPDFGGPRDYGQRDYGQDRWTPGDPYGYQRGQHEQRFQNDRGRQDQDWQFQGQRPGWQESRFGQGGQFEGRSGGQTASRGRPPKGYTRSDERIREDLCDRISEHGDIDASEVEVKVQNGEVILTGTVEERRFKHMLERIAESIAGVTDVRNEIRMQRQGKQQQTGVESKNNPTTESKSAGNLPGQRTSDPGNHRNATS